MYFETKKGLVYGPVNPELQPFYESLKKHAPSLSGSQAFDDLVEAYESIDFEMKEEKENVKKIKLA